MSEELHRVRAGIVAVILCVLPRVAASFEGDVREEATGKPIAGAFVTAVWRGSVPNPVQAADRCYHLELVATDSNGKFRVPDSPSSIKSAFTNGIRYFDVYAPGFVVSKNSSNVEGKFRMIPRSGSKEEQFELVKLPSTSDCGLPSTKGPALALLKAVYREQSSLAVTRKQKRSVVEGTLQAIEEIELGERKARENADIRLYQGKNIPPALQ